MSAPAVQSQNNPHEPRNKGQPIGQKRPLKPKDVWNIRVRLQIMAGKRDLAMFAWRSTANCAAAASSA